MQTVLVIGLVVAVVSIVGWFIRRDSGGYRRRFPPVPGLRQRSETGGTDATPMIWVSGMIPVDSGSHGGMNPGCTDAGQTSVDCGASIGADGGSS